MIVPVEIEVEGTVGNFEPTATGSIVEVEEEGALGKESEKGEDGRNKEIVPDWEFVGTGTSSPEKPYVLPAAQKSIVDGVSRQEVPLDNGQNIKGPFPLTDEKEGGNDAQDGVDPELRTVVEEVRVREESVSREEGKPDVEIRKPISEQLILYPIFPTFQHPADQMEFPISTIEPTTPAPAEAEAVETAAIDPESQKIESEDDAQEEGVMLELPEEDPMEEDFMSNEERENSFESFELESTEGTATPQPVLVSPTSEHLPPTIGPNYIPDMKAGVEIATLKSYSQQKAQLEESGVDGQEGIILEERMSTEEELVKDEEKGSISGIFEHEEIRGLASAQQGSLEGSLASPGLDCSEDQLDIPLSAITLPKAGTEVTENYDLKPELQQDLMLEQFEHKQSQENNSEMPESLVPPVPPPIEQPTAQPKPESLADPISRPQAKIEGVEMATSIPEQQEQVLSEETKWEERHETALEHPKSSMLVPGSPVPEQLVESPSSSPESVHIPDSKPLVGDPTNTRSEPESSLPGEKEEGLKELVWETELSKAISPSPTSANQSQPSPISPPHVKSELVGTMEVESKQDTPHEPEPPKRSGSGRMMEEEKGQPISYKFFDVQTNGCRLQLILHP